MNKQAIALISPLLKETFEKYKKQGMISIYLWGSVTTNDYNPKTSDIDSIAIVSNKFDHSLESTIQKELQKAYTGTNRFGFRIFYEDELKSNTLGTKSVLATQMSPRLYIYDLPYWIFIVGKLYAITELTDNPVTHAEALGLRLEEIEDRNWSDATKIPENEMQYYIKCLWRIVHILQAIREQGGQFSYSNVVLHTDQDEIGIITTLKEIKASSYASSLFEKHVSELQMFVDGVKRKTTTH